jgi:tetratricopeptide (TPR) repeat protein
MTPGTRRLFLLALVLAGALAASAAEKPAAPDAAALHRKGLEAVAARDWATAVDALEAATAAAPNDIVIGADYRQAIIGAANASKKVQPYERCLAFFETLVAKHPQAANAFLNYGFAHVDKIPAEGAITQVIRANDALTQFGKALEIEDSWLGRYSRGHAYLYWPAIFRRADLGIADLERAVAQSREKGDKKAYYAFAWAALGDGHWRKSDVARARQIWKEGLALYPDSTELKDRASRTDDAELDAYLEKHYDVTARVATHLNEIYTDRSAKVSSK